MKFSRNAQLITLLAGASLLTGAALSTQHPATAPATMVAPAKNRAQVAVKPRAIKRIVPNNAAQIGAGAPLLADTNAAQIAGMSAILTADKPTNMARARVVCIDPGHPSETSDGANSHGLSENRLNWQVALELKPVLEKLGVKCVMTKSSENKRVTNRERAETANRAGAELFLRLHCDEGTGRGWRWYYPDRSGKKYGVSGPPQNVQRASGRAANILTASMKKSDYLRGYLQSNPVTTDASTFVGGKQGGVLTGSIFARVPTALIEMCFINQKNDAKFIASEVGRKRMAYALAQAIVVYLNQTPPDSWK